MPVCDSEEFVSDGRRRIWQSIEDNGKQVLRNAQNDSVTDFFSILSGITNPRRKGRGLLKDD